MIVSRSLESLPFDYLRHGSVVTIGSYDGVHRGHQKLLQEVLSYSAQRSIPSVVMSFEPTPKEYFSADRPPSRLMSFREKHAALDEAGIDVLFCPRFDKSMRDIEVSAFIRRILIHGLNANTLVLGDDFRFGSDRSGGIDDLMRAGKALAVTVSQLQSVNIDGVRVSSTAIRQALAEGQLDVAEKLLGKPYRLSGKVVEGRKLGRTLGFPTANVKLNRKRSAVLGTFAARVTGIGQYPMDAVVNVGVRPTFNGVNPLLEAHIFDFDGDLYGQRIHVEFVRKLRNEKKFENVEALVQQLHTDAQSARDILAN